MLIAQSMQIRGTAPAFASGVAWTNHQIVLAARFGRKDYMFQPQRVEDMHNSTCKTAILPKVIVP
jgi:hypothetical protein